MDDLQRHNQSRWNNLVANKVVCSQPLLSITEEQAINSISGHQWFGLLEGKKVLCLASGGGQQSMAFAKLGAQVTVTDLSDKQLEKDREASANNELPIRIIQSDMRDFHHFQEEEFDIIYQPYSINYVPDVQEVFEGITRCLKTGGIYYVMFHNPISHGSWTNGSWGGPWKPEELWRGYAYAIRHPYQEGIPIQYESPNWLYTDQEGVEHSVPAPQEFKHTLSTMINGLLNRNMQLLQFQECALPAPEDMKEVGSWEHYQGHAAPWFELWAKKEG